MKRMRRSRNRALGRLGKKRRLRRAVEKYRDDATTLADPATEKEPLCLPASVFRLRP
jgi:hypothetical protein